MRKSGRSTPRGALIEAKSQAHARKAIVPLLIGAAIITINKLDGELHVGSVMQDGVNDLQRRHCTPNQVTLCHDSLRRLQISLTPKLPTRRI